MIKIKKKSCCKRENFEKIEDNLFKCVDCGTYLRKAKDGFYYVIKKPNDKEVMKRTENILEYRNILRNHILEKFQNKEFIMRDVYYSMYNGWNKNEFGRIWNGIIALHKEGFLKRSFKDISVPYSRNLKTRVVFKIKINE